MASEPAERDFDSDAYGIACHEFLAAFSKGRGYGSCLIDAILAYQSRMATKMKPAEEVAASITHDWLLTDEMCAGQATAQLEEIVVAAIRADRKERGV